MFEYFSSNHPTNKVKVIQMMIIIMLVVVQRSKCDTLNVIRVLIG